MTPSGTVHDNQAALIGNACVLNRNAHACSTLDDLSSAKVYSMFRVYVCFYVCACNSVHLNISESTCVYVKCKGVQLPVLSNTQRDQ